MESSIEELFTNEIHVREYSRLDNKSKDIFDKANESEFTRINRLIALPYITLKSFNDYVNNHEKRKLLDADTQTFIKVSNRTMLQIISNFDKIKNDHLKLHYGASFGSPNFPTFLVGNEFNYVEITMRTIEGLYNQLFMMADILQEALEWMSVVIKEQVGDEVEESRQELPATQGDDVPAKNQQTETIPEEGDLNGDV